MAGAVAGRRGWVRCDRPLWRYTGGHAWVASDSFCHSFCFLAALSVVLAVRGFGRGLDANGNGVVVRECLGPPRFPGTSLPPSSSEACTPRPWRTCTTNWSSSAVTDPGSPPTHPAVKHEFGEYLFELRERLLAMRSAALGYSQRGEDQEGDPEDSWPAYPTGPQPKRRSWTVRDSLQLVVFVVFVVLFGLPAFLSLCLSTPYPSGRLAHR